MEHASALGWNEDTSGKLLSPLLYTGYTKHACSFYSYVVLLISTDFQEHSNGRRLQAGKFFLLPYLFNILFEHVQYYVCLSAHVGAVGMAVEASARLDDAAGKLSERIIFYFSVIPSHFHKIALSLSLSGGK